MGRNQRMIYRKNDDAWNQKVQEVLEMIPETGWKDLTEIIKDMKGDSSPDAITALDTPVQKKWEMIYFIATGAHLWELVRLPSGNDTWHDQGDISDILLQVYKNGWILRACNALDCIYNFAYVNY